MRSLVWAVMGSALLLPGCLDREAADPHMLLSEVPVNRVSPPSRATSRTVRCGCDADGGLHVQTPQGSQVTVPEDARYDAEAQIVLPEDDRQVGTPLRRTRSLGFIGDNKLGESRTRGGPWNAPDGLLPPHSHGGGSYGGGYGHGSYGSYRPVYAPASMPGPAFTPPDAHSPHAPASPGPWTGRRY